MKAKLIFRDLGTLLDFIAKHSKKIRFGIIDERKVFCFAIKQEIEGYSIIIEPKDTDKESENNFQKVIEQAQKEVGFIRLEQTTENLYYIK